MRDPTVMEDRIMLWAITVFLTACLVPSLVIGFLERDSPKYERAALRWLARYLEESEPSLEAFAKLASGLARRAPPNTD